LREFQKVQQFIEFAGNHAVLSAAFVGVFMLLIWTEVTRRLGGIKELSPGEAVMMINRGNPSLVDVSSVADYNKGHITGAQNIALSRFAKPDPEIEKLKSKPVLVICKNGVTARQAASSLVKLGVPEVALLKGGMTQWRSDNYPVSSAK
jgi:rhodanese-related sulfurtransferase